MTPAGIRGEFDDAALRAIAAQLKPGVVIRIHSQVAEKTKRHVLITSSASRALAFFINSRPAPFIERNPELLKRQLPMLRNEHAFMDHDSVVACHDVVAMPAGRELARAVAAGRAEILGTISPGLSSQLAQAAAGSPLISGADMALIEAAFK